MQAVAEFQSSAKIGKRIQFTAKVERSDDDEHFGFFSRPTKASYVEDAA